MITSATVVQAGLGSRVRTFCRLTQIVCLMLLTAFSAEGQRVAKKSTRSFIPDSKPLNALPGVRYVGSEKCKLCHSAIFKTFSQTDMAQATSFPVKAVEKGWLTTPLEFYNENTNRHYRVFTEGSKVFQTEYELDTHDKQIFSHTEELAYIVGTGANGATPLVRRGNYLFQAPISYYTGRNTWDLSPNYEMHDIGFTLPVTPDCIGCHAGKTRPVQGHEGLFEDPPVVELGISCERCHGPGELHVKERMAGLPARGLRDNSIVNPAKLSPWLADNICMNCHEGDNRTLQPGRVAADFRPGTPLNDVAVLLKTPIDLDNAQSPLLEHFYSMSLSKCYRASGKLGCQSCHDPHVQPRGEDAPSYFRAKCIRCHSEKDCTAPKEARQAQSPPDACTNCHMPKLPVLTVSHSTLTNHRIVRSADEPLPTIAFHETLSGTGYIHVNAIPGVLDKVPPVVLLQAYRRELIGGHLQFKTYYFDLLAQLSKIPTKDPFILSALSQKEFSDGNLSRAIALARQVVNQGSTSANDYLLLDQVLAKAGELQECIRVLQKALQIAPYNNFVYQRLAMRQFASGDTQDALATLDRGLQLWPEDTALREMKERAERAGKP